MAFDAFLWFQDTATTFLPAGESTDPVFGQGTPYKAFQIDNFGFGVKNTVTIGSGTMGAGAGKCELNVFKFKKKVDSGSTNLFNCCTSGKHVAAAVLMLRKAGGVDTSAEGKSQPCYLCFKFMFCYINAVSWSGSSGDDEPTEDLSFAYGAMEISYKKQLTTGLLITTPIVTAYSQALNVAELTVASGFTAKDIVLPAESGWI
jgi:type VI secretion system secreted protein Hcp